MPDDTETRQDRQNPVITFSSFEEDDDYELEEDPSGNGTIRRKKGTLRKGHSLTVPSVNLADEPKRPPL